MWRYLKHPNIAPFMGVTMSPPQLISKWLPGGNLLEYLVGHPIPDRLGLVGVPSVVAIPCLCLLPYTAV